jgi:hypothetical protein
MTAIGYSSEEEDEGFRARIDSKRGRKVLQHSGTGSP